MKWTDTVASNCRYGSIAERLFKDAEIIWEDSDDDYQGYATVLAQMADGRFCLYDWTYGSCSGCDEWEDRGLSDDEIEIEMCRAAAFFSTVEQVQRYFHLDPYVEDVPWPSANLVTNGSVPGMLHSAFGGIGDEFKAAGAAFEAWLGARRLPAGQCEPETAL